MPKKAVYSSEEAQFIKNIGFKIQFLRKKNSMSQGELAEAAGLSETTLAHIEATQPYGISIKALYRIAVALDVEPWVLLKHDDS